MKMFARKRGYSFVPDACDHLRASLGHDKAHAVTLATGRGAIFMGCAVLAILMIAGMFS